MIKTTYLQYLIFKKHVRNNKEEWTHPYEKPNVLKKLKEPLSIRIQNKCISSCFFRVESKEMTVIKTSLLHVISLYARKGALCISYSLLIESDKNNVDTFDLKISVPVTRGREVVYISIHRTTTSPDELRKDVESMFDILYRINAGERISESDVIKTFNDSECRTEEIPF